MQDLLIDFDKSRAIIRCADPALHTRLARYFHHCLPDSPTLPKNIVAHYSIKPHHANRFQLFYNNTLIHPDATALYAFTYLIRDVPAKLITRTQTQLVFHAAGLAASQTSQNNAGFLFAGPSGRGKSTLAAWLLRQGLAFLSDEIILLDPDTLTLQGLTTPIVLKAGARPLWQGWLGEQADDTAPHQFNGAVWFNPDTLRPGGVIQQARLSRIIFPHYRASATFRLRRLSAAQGAFHLMHHLVNFKQLPDQGFHQISQLCRRVPVYQCDYANVDPLYAWLAPAVTP